MNHDLAGIAPDPDGPGFRKVLIRPQPVGDLTWARATDESVRGVIRSDWTRNDHLFKLEVGRYPTAQEGLQALISAPPGVNNWNGPYWKKTEVPKDPWGNEYKYGAPGQHGPYDLLSYGADGKEGGEGPNKDITNW